MLALVDHCEAMSLVSFRALQQECFIQLAKFQQQLMAPSDQLAWYVVAV